jgi:hypothetical protein
MDARCQRPPRSVSEFGGSTLDIFEIEVTVDDPTAYTKPWSVTLRPQFAADTELIDD